jgi:hypothetical protein
MGDDGREKIQLRLDLGVLQMEATGRPDGKQPHDHETLLGYHESQSQEYIKTHGSAEGFEIDDRVCSELRAEGIMFYHRYLATFVLGDYESVARDTRRNLRMFDFCAAYATNADDREMLEQNRPYVMMMHTRAKAQASLQRKHPKRALTFVRKGLKEIEEIFRQLDREDMIESSKELSVLKTLIKEIKERIPVDPITKLRKELRQAIEEERYEDAAELRDQLSKEEIVDESASKREP